MAKAPPVPPAGRTNKGAGAVPQARDKGERDPAKDQQRNLAEQGRQGNIRQNTRNQGYQQDR